MSQFLSKRVSNYELFFDLAVVLAIGQLTSAIHLNHIGLQEVLAFITTNIIIFNIWHNEVLYLINTEILDCRIFTRLLLSCL